MIIDSFNTDKDVLIIAEIGNNHEGKYNLAEKMICLAAESGANAVKFQTIRTEHLIRKKDAARFKRLKSFELTYKEFEKLSKVAEKEGLIFLSTPFDIESARFLNNIVPVFKIASGDNNFYPLIEVIAGTGKPIILSTGLADLKEIRKTKLFIEKKWNEKRNKQDLAILHCVSSYPVPLDEVNLLAIRTLEKMFRCTVGYSDHSIGIEAAALSVAIGARIVEKHFTFDKNYSDFHDHKLSVNPKEMAILVKRIRKISAMLGSGEKILQNSEKMAKNSLHRAIVARHDLQKGEKVKSDDIDWLRPAIGLPPGKEYLVIGKRLLQSVKKGEPLLPKLLNKEENA